VASFQESQNLVPSGLVDALTWLALHSPVVPVPKPVPHVNAQPLTSVVNVRLGPSLDFNTLGRLYTGGMVDVVGKIVGATAETTWWQVCCISGQKGWVRSDVVRLAGSADALPAITANAQPTREPSPAANKPKSGEPLLDHLPAQTADGNPIVYLTFDDGPNGTYTPKVIDLLAKYHATATFFVIGQFAHARPDLVRAVANAGHYVANHTYTHITLQGVTQAKFIEESESTRKTLLEEARDLFTLDGDVRYLRPPYGATDAHTRGFAAAQGYQVVLWDVDPQDWRRPGTETISSHILRHVFPGAIVLMHDGGGDRSQTVAALDTVLRELSARGFKFHMIAGN
jgi:peptidoglycan-N-acetylglucosamine deacetylase